MKSKELKASILLLIASIIWGFAFTAQRVGIKYVGSFTFNGVRFALGAISLIPLVLLNNKANKARKAESKNTQSKGSGLIRTVKAGMLIGFTLFMGATFQQLGLEETTAGKAAFITGFYIVLVPFCGVFLKQKISKNTWIAAIFAIIGLYLISVTEDFTISRGDLLELISSFFWTAHIMLISRFTRDIDPLNLSLIQNIICSMLSLCFALAIEDIALNGLIQASVPILYGGIASVGIAYTLQVYGQKYAKPAHAAIILSLESVFAAIGEFLILGETMSLKGYTGCALMFAGVIISQVGSIHGDRAKNVQTEVHVN